MQIGLKKEESGGFTYSVATFKKLYDFTGDELQRVAAYAAAFREQAKASVVERAELNKAAAENNIEITQPLPQLSDNEGHFDIVGSVIDGDRVPLPA